MPASSASETMPISGDPTSSHGSSVESNSEPAVETPVVNIWEARRKENEAKSQKTEKLLDTSSRRSRVLIQIFIRIFFSFFIS